MLCGKTNVETEGVDNREVSQDLVEVDQYRGSGKSNDKKIESDWR
jgi:hypothetical protein